MRDQVGLVLAHCGCGGRVNFNTRRSSLEFGAAPQLVTPVRRQCGSVGQVARRRAAGHSTPRRT